MGVSMALGFQSAIRKGTDRKAQLVSSLIRGCTLICLGLFLNNGHDVAHWRMPGVLQYFGFSYIVVSIIVGVVPTHPRSIKSTHHTFDRQFSISRPLLVDGTSVNHDFGEVDNSLDVDGTYSDLKPHALQWFAALFLPITYVALAWGVTAPGCPTGYLGPGGVTRDMIHYTRLSSHVTRQTPHVTRHNFLVNRHSSHASRRIC